MRKLPELKDALQAAINNYKTYSELRNKRSKDSFFSTEYRRNPARDGQLKLLEEILKDFSASNNQTSPFAQLQIIQAAIDYTIKEIGRERHMLRQTGHHSQFRKELKNALYPDSRSREILEQPQVQKNNANALKAYLSARETCLKNSQPSEKNATLLERIKDVLSCLNDYITGYASDASRAEEKMQQRVTNLLPSS